jgi:hypothetical protein
MWVFTTEGFYSVVAHRTRPGYLLVRARAREDLEALKARIPSLEPFEDASADYRWRAEVKASDWQNALAELGGAIDYDNFKNAVGERQGSDRARVYSGVWSVVRALQRNDA